MLWTTAFCTMLCALCGVLVACSSDDEIPADDQNGRLNLISCTRATPPDYNFIDNTKLWLALASGTTLDSEGSYTYSTSTGKWTGGITVKEAKQYYLYGLMLPNGSVSGDLNCGITSSDYSKGAMLTVKGVTPMLEDSQVPCVVVGARGVTIIPTDPDELAASWDVTEGQFGYMGILKKGEDNAQLLLDRLYAALTFSFDIDADYAALRTIKLKKLELKASDEATIPNKVDLAVVLEANNSGKSPIKSVSATQSINSTPTSVASSLLFPIVGGDAAGVDISTLTGAVATAKIGCVYLASDIAYDISSDLYVRCEYDVYDKPTTGGPHLLASRTVENSLRKVLTTGSLPPGKKSIIKLKVAPTYLYILSDADLDNPVITIVN